MTGHPLPVNPLECAARERHLTAMADKGKEREERLAAALRENLKRRKAQSRAIAKCVGDDALEPDA